MARHQEPIEDIPSYLRGFLQSAFFVSPNICPWPALSVVDFVVFLVCRFGHPFCVRSNLAGTIGGWFGGFRRRSGRANNLGTLLNPKTERERLVWVIGSRDDRVSFKTISNNLAPLFPGSAWVHAAPEAPAS
ncbi:hypothetical protein FHS27_001025 [Rhodopirellula rubra]|uniref:Uncharacterized protein n=1 Tax=Aporhodopirellula rubra TaxID=980271 RepID=A0A7W5H4S0_9BACT|nr:hypothetical protein [Aporhodopirellula rubra]